MMPGMFALSLRHANHIRSYSVSARDASGWEVRLEEDCAVRRLEHYRDWHRVERALAFIEREVSELKASGWQVAGTAVSR